MMHSIQVSALTLVPLASVAVSLVLAGEPLSWIWLKSFGFAVSATVGAITFFDRWAWKRHFLQGWFVKRPILAGDWTFDINPFWTDPENANRRKTIVSKVTIRQTYTKLHLRLKTPDSTSDFIASRIVAKDDGTYQVLGIYQNQPKISVQDRSRTHMGALVLDVAGDPFSPSKLNGHYWTDRGTRGEIYGKRIR